MRLILMTYMNRSGSTYLANLLSSSAKICVCPEGDWLVSYFLEDPGRPFSLTDKNRELISNRFRKDEKLKTWNLDPGVYKMLLSAETNFQAFCIILAQYKLAQKPSASMVLFKAERLAALINKILNLQVTDYQVTVLSIIRDPRAVISSQMVTRMPGTQHMMAAEPVRAAVYWRNHIGSISKSGNPNQMLIIRYEDLISKTHDTVNKIGNYLDVDLSDTDPASGDLLYRLPPSHLDIHQNVTKNPINEKIDSWENTLSMRNIYLIQKICRSGMEQAAYPVSDSRMDLYAEIILMLKLLANFLRQIRKKIHYQINKSLKLGHI